MKTIFHPTHFWMLAAVIAFFTACASPQPVSRLVPLERTDRWWHGRELVQLPEEGGIAVDVVFQKSTPQYLILDLWIQNRSGQSVLVDPVQFSLQGLEADTQTVVAAPLRALDPEVVLLDLDKRESREIAEGQNSASLELLSLTLDAASDISSIGKDEDPEERAQELEERQVRREDYEIEQTDRDYRLGTLDEQRGYWETATIRKTSLDTEYQLKGSLFFPRQNQAAFFHFKGTIDGRKFQFYLRQRLFQP